RGDQSDRGPNYCVQPAQLGCTTSHMNPCEATDARKCYRTRIAGLLNGGGYSASRFIDPNERRKINPAGTRGACARGLVRFLRLNAHLLAVWDPAAGRLRVIRPMSSMSTLAASNENRFHFGRWLLFSDYGELARRNMAVSWACVAGLGLVVSIWWPRSS